MSTSSRGSATRWPRAATAAAFALAGIAVVIASRPAGAAGENSVSPNTASNCSPGQTAVVPTRSVTDALGVNHVSYASYPGFVVTIPPKGFRADTATTALLKDLHTPDSGQSASALTRTRYINALSQIAANGTAPTFCAVTHPEYPPAANNSPVSATPGFTFSHVESANWAGYAVDGTWDGVYGAWTVQTSISGPDTPNIDGTWIGIGGDQTDVNNHPASQVGLIQLGTQMATGSGYQSWFEWVSENNTINPQYTSYDGVVFYGTSDTVRPGDAVWGSVYWESSTEACFTFDDTSRSTGSFAGCVTNIPVPYDRNSMEWIDEDPPGNYLADFGHTYWTNQEAYNPSTDQYVPFTNYAYSGYVMRYGTGKPSPPCGGPHSADMMAYGENASSADNGSSDDVWCAEGPN